MRGIKLIDCNKLQKLTNDGQKGEKFSKIFYLLKKKCKSIIAIGFGEKIVKLSDMRGRLDMRG